MNYPDKIRVRHANQVTLDFIAALKKKPRTVAEIGVWKGHTSRGLLSMLPPDGKLHLFDFDQTVQRLVAELDDRRVIGHGNTDLLLDSYNWSLAQLIKANAAPIFDYVYIDGAHTWAIDALAFFLVDRLLKPGGYVDLDDYNWRIARSSLSPRRFPKIRQWYTKEQMQTPQVAMIVDLLIKRSRDYREIVTNKVFQKTAT